jgi:hypothetical protein
MFGIRATEYLPVYPVSEVGKLLNCVVVLEVGGTHSAKLARADVCARS